MHAVDRILHPLVVTLALDGDLFAQIAPTDLPKDAIAFTDGHQDGVEHLVDTVDDLAENSLKAIGFAAFFQLSLLAVVDQLGEFGLKTLHDECNIIDVLLHLLMVALVGLGNQFVDPSGSDLAEDAVALADWQQDRIEHLVNALDDVGVAT